VVGTGAEAPAGPPSVEPVEPVETTAAAQRWPAAATRYPSV